MTMPALRFAPPAAAHQRGAVLIVSLILLVVMTLLGVSSMNTTSLEEKMASNSQETTRAFQTAETGISMGFNDNSAYSLTAPYDPGDAAVPNTSDSVRVRSGFIGWSPPPTGSLYSATSFQAAHFNFNSVGTVGPSGNTVAVTLDAGAYQIAPKQN